MSYRKINVAQGTEEWKAIRRQYLTASQAPVLFGISPYQSRLDLYEEKLFGREMPIDDFRVGLFAKAYEAEAQAREWILSHMGIRFAPSVLVSVEHPELLASLDGHDESGDVILEAKYMGTSSLAEMKNHQFKPHHICQIQAQLLVSGAKKCMYFATDPNGEAAVAEIEPDPSYQGEIARLAEAFMRDLRAGEAPEPSDRDTLVVEDDPRFEELQAARAVLDQAEAHFEKLKKAIAKEYEKHRRIRCGEITFTRSLRKGNVQYAKIPELKSIDLEKYRGAPIETVTVRFGKGSKS
jgi:putative phage-type endonuclease